MRVETQMQTTDTLLVKVRIAFLKVFREQEDDDESS